MQRLLGVLTSLRGNAAIISTVLILFSRQLFGIDLTDAQVDAIVWIAGIAISGDTLRQIGGTKTIFDTVIPAILKLIEELKKKSNEPTA